MIVSGSVQLHYSSGVALRTASKVMVTKIPRRASRTCQSAYPGMKRGGGLVPCAEKEERKACTPKRPAVELRGAPRRRHAAPLAQWLTEAERPGCGAWGAVREFREF